MLARLDAGSRLFCQRSAVRLGCYASVAASAWLLFTGHSADDFANNLQLACTLGAFLAVGRAYRLSERINGPALNSWDEGMVLNLLSLGIHILQRVSG